MITGLPDSLREAQRIFKRTGGLHATGLFDTEGNLLLVREDVGRYNAVDKLIGHMLLDGRVPPADRILMVSGARLTAGRSYARSGQVLDLSINPGVVTASVQGSRARPYKVSIRLKPLSERQWGRLERTLSERALLIAKLLADEMPPEIEEVFERCNLSLFPASRRALVTDCSCPNWGNPCEHLAAAYYILAEKFDDDPFLIFLWRGRSKRDLIKRLRKKRAGTRTRRRREPKFAPPQSLRERASTTSGSPVRISPTSTSTRRRLRRRRCSSTDLGPLPDEAGGPRFTEMLVGAYANVAAAAERRAWLRPRHRSLDTACDQTKKTVPEPE